ncbi:MAG: hypothetical protein IKV63_04510 [Clostridia bacterium]|nr:hypothetical protein [Clostridia bacterium]
MEWKLAFWASLIVLVLSGIGAYRMRRTKNKIIRPFNIITGGVFLSVVLIIMPVYINRFAGGQVMWVRTILMSCYNTVKIFLVDGELDIVTEGVMTGSQCLNQLYTILASILYVAAPALSFSIVLSFFKNIAAYRHFIASRSKDMYIFSDLSDRSIALASDIMSNNKMGRAVVFCDVNDETDIALREKADNIGAICFKKEIEEIDFTMRKRRKSLNFIVMNENENTNVMVAMHLIAKYKNQDNVHLHAFYTGLSRELQIAAADKGKMRVRRIDDTRSVIHHILYTEGTKFFESAVPQENGKKRITAVIVGMGTYGMAMLKALAWYCQMDGYEINIHAFDKDKMAYDKLCVQAPELMSEKYNGVYVEGEGAYSISVYPETDVDTKSFADKIYAIDDITYAIVALGNDEKNIETAAYLRMLFERKKDKPVIQAIVRDSDKKNALKDVTNYAGQRYDIDFIGDLEAVYCEDVIIDTELEKDALGRHLKWGKENEFWDYEYNYRSSIAAAIHLRAKQACGIPGANKTTDQLTTEERDNLEAIEHKRWNVYMRSEGYVYSGSRDRSSRNHLAKTHCDLVDFDSLSEEDKRKDSKVGAK